MSESCLSCVPHVYSGGWAAGCVHALVHATWAHKRWPPRAKLVGRALPKQPAVEEGEAAATEAERPVACRQWAHELKRNRAAACGALQPWRVAGWVSRQQCVTWLVGFRLSGQIRSCSKAVGLGLQLVALWACCTSRCIAFLAEAPGSGLELS